MPFLLPQGILPNLAMEAIIRLIHSEVNQLMLDIDELDIDEGYLTKHGTC